MTPAVPARVLWLTGPMGVGKSTVGHAAFVEVSRSHPAAYVDVDQVGMRFPVPPDDPGHDRLKADALAALWPAHLRAGVRRLVVSGGVGTRADLRVAAAGFAGAAVTTVRLRLPAEEVRRRFAARGGTLADRLAEAVAEVAAFEASDVADVVVDTAGLTPDAAARAVLTAAGEGWER